MRVLFIRHADPDYARDTITEIGHQQARALARKLFETRLERLYVSPMGRAQATARYIAETQQLEPVTLDWMRELNGNWVGDRWAWNMPGAETLDTDAIRTAAKNVVRGRHRGPGSRIGVGHNLEIPGI